MLTCSMVRAAVGTLIARIHSDRGRPARKRRRLQAPDRRFEVAGHTDARGTDEYNHRLGQRRAISVVEHLARAGVPAERLVVRSYGESRPIAPNARPDGSDDPEGRALNRRVEIVDLAM